jgi:CotS family spore coat protein
VSIAETREVLSRWGIEPTAVQPVKVMESGRAIWQVDSDAGRYVLKRVRLPERAARVAGVGPYLAAQGLPVVASIPTPRGEPFVVEQERPHLLFPWVDGTRPDYGKPGAVDTMCRLLAQFHERSAGYAATGAPCEWELDWRPFYDLQLKRLERSTREALRRYNDPVSRTLWAELPWLHARGRWAREQLERVGLPDLIAQAEQDPLLAHGDYSRDNVLVHADGALTIIDLDQTAVALPVFDISRLVTWINHDQGDWSGARLDQVVQAYEQVRPLSGSEKDLLLVDQVFPHQALAIARAYYAGPESGTLPEELARCLATDRAKLADLGLGPAP